MDWPLGAIRWISSTKSGRKRRCCARSRDRKPLSGRYWNQLHLNPLIVQRRCSFISRIGTRQQPQVAGRAGRRLEVMNVDASERHIGISVAGFAAIADGTRDTRRLATVE